MANITGTNLPNVLTGTGETDTILGLGGNDELRGEGGSDILDGGLGRDRMYGGSGDDDYFVDNEEDKVLDDVNGGTDTVFSSVSFSLVDTNAENLVLSESGGAIDGSGNASGNTLIGNSFANKLSGGDGNDRIDGGGGADVMIGGLGDDTFFVDNIGDVVIEAADRETGPVLNPVIISGGNDTIYSTVSFTLPSHVENLVLEGSGAIDGSGNAQRNWLIGNDGNNTLYGFGKDDILDGGLGADTLIGGEGDDRFFVDDAGDITIEYANEGNDTVYSSVDYALGDNLENLTLLAGGITGTGNLLANIMTSSSDDDILVGLAGDDQYHIQNEGDTVVEAAGLGTDTVFSLATRFTLPDHVENLVLKGSDNLDGVGNDVRNVLTGNDGNNTLNGAGGADSMAGRGGDDIYYVDNAGDTITELFGGGIDTVMASIDFVLSKEVENLTLTGAGNINGTGNTMSNILIGNDGDNTLSGASSKDKTIDVLNGGLGNDTLYGGKSKGDIFVFDTALGSGNIDTLADFKKDFIALDAEIFTSLSAGALNSDNFLSGNAAIDNDDFIIHDQATGMLYYDADGSGAIEKIAFAIVSGKLAASDFTIFDSGGA